jgi:hypothetical protein
MPPNQELEGQLRSYIASKKSAVKDDTNPSIHEKLKERGRDLLDSRNLRFESLKKLAELHWIGDDWKEEVLYMSNPPKHDPAKELITKLKVCDDGSAEVTTETSAESRVYRVELVNERWLIRKYVWSPNAK